MNISKINSNISFGKQPLMVCNVKDNKTKKSNEATLYKLDPLNENDRKDVFFSKQTDCIQKDFVREWYIPRNYRNFYLLQNDKTGEVISCAQTIHKCNRPEAKHAGIHTLIEEINENKKYLNGAEPLLSYIVKKADENYDNFVCTAFDEETLQGLKRYKFSQLKTGDYYIPQKRFSTLIDQAEKRYQTEYTDNRQYY